MTRENYELNRTNSLCPTPQSRLFDFVKSNRAKEVIKLVNEYGKDLLSQIYDHPYYKTIIEIACSNLAGQISSDTLQTLIDLGANLNSSNEHFDRKTCLHFATESGNPNILNIVLQNIDESQINSTCEGGNTALHCLVKYCENSDKDLTECVKLLVQNPNFDVNKTDDKNLTAIFYAARKGKKEIVNSILKYSILGVDIDSHKLRGKSARDFIQEKQLYDEVLPLHDDSRHGNNNDPLNILCSYLFDLKEDEFVRSGHLSPTTANEANDRMSLLQLATSKGLKKAVEKLLELGADPNKTTEKTPETPIEIASAEGYYEILKILIEKTSYVPQNALLNCLKMSEFDSVDSKRDYQKCCQILLEKPIDIHNFEENDSLLHYAVRYGGPDVTLTLLQAGASLACKNRYGIMPVEDIDSNTMEKHLDTCLEANLEKSVEAENFEAVYNYKTLMPPKRHISQKNKVKEVNSFSTTEDIEAASVFLKRELDEFSSEMELVTYMSESSELRHLLKHPVITSFLYMKWLRLSKFFYTNLVFYLTFCFSLLLYVFVNYNVEDPENSAPSTGLTILLSVLFTILFLRELFQILLSPKTYFLSFENWIELILVFFTAVILFQKSPTESVRKQSSALVILLAAFEVVLLVGQHPKMATNIVMLRTVSYNFFKFFMWYAILIIAFALSFHVMFKNTNENKSGNLNGTVAAEEEDNEQDFFMNPGVSLFKTFVMLTGEFDASSIDFQQYPITSHIIFALFIFMIAIILFNLLNGLAVSDTQMIKSNAELVGHVSRIQHITYIENMFLGNLLPNSLLKLLENKFCCVKIPENKFKFLKPFAYSVCLFPHYIKDYKLKVFPNRLGRVVLPQEKTNIDNSVDSGCINDCKFIYLDRKTVKRTRQLIRDRKNELERLRIEEENERKQKEIIEDQRKKIDEIKNEQRLITQKLDTLLSNLNSVM